VDTNEWQLSEIQAALTEAEAQDYATDQDMARGLALDLSLAEKQPAREKSAHTAWAIETG